MNAILANNVKTLRREKNWTQEHLAQASGVLLRTVQRVEAAKGASVETLSALANGFGVPVEFFRIDFEALAAELNAASLGQTHDIVHMAQITCAADWSVIEGAHGSLIQCAAKDDAVQDIFAGLKADLVDMIDIWEDVDPRSHLEWTRSLFSHVKKLNTLGCVVSAGRRVATFHGTKIPALYVVVWPKADAREIISVEI